MESETEALIREFESAATVEDALKAAEEMVKRLRLLEEKLADASFQQMYSEIVPT